MGKAGRGSAGATSPVGGSRFNVIYVTFLPGCDLFEDLAWIGFVCDGKRHKSNHKASHSAPFQTLC